MTAIVDDMIDIDNISESKSFGQAQTALAASLSKINEVLDQFATEFTTEKQHLSAIQDRLTKSRVFSASRLGTTFGIPKGDHPRVKIYT